MNVIKKYPNAPLTTIDWSKATSPPSSSVSAEISMALKTQGFFYVENVAGYSAEELEAATKWFYGKSLHFKMQVARKDHNPHNPCRYRGYKPIEAGILDGQTETIELGGFDDDDRVDRGKSRHHHRDNDDDDEGKVYAKDLLGEGNLWPEPMEPGDEEEIAEFKRIVKNHHALLSELGLSILSHLAVDLGLSPDAFADFFHPDPLSSLRLLHYPTPEIPIEVGASQSEDDVMYGQHTDAGCVTLLTTFGWGLQLLHDGKWYNVAPQKDAIICNVGDTLARLTNGRVNSTVHRVAKIGEERYSVPFFLEPKYDAEIRRLVRGGRQEEEEIEALDWEVVRRDYMKKNSMWYRYGPWMVQNLQRIEEFRMVDFGIL